MAEERMDRDFDVIRKQVSAMKRSKVVTSVLTLVLGLVLVIWPNETLDLLCRIIGMGLCIGGVIAIVLFLVNKERMYMSYFSLAAGVVVAVIGLWLFLEPAVLANLLPTILGLLIIVNGIVNVSEAFTIRREKGGTELIAGILAIVTLALGALIFFHPSFFNAIIYRLIGVVLLYNGASNIWIISQIRGVAREVQREMNTVDTTAREVDAEEAESSTTRQE